jgi:L-asparaginase II
VWRGDLIESIHRGRYAVYSSGGKVLDSLGDLTCSIYLRSTAKPFQALPLVFSGAAEAFGITDQELAVVCASHNAEPEHLAAVRTILDKAGLSEADLQSGAHPPIYAPAAEKLSRSGEKPRPIHGNCSGKHAGMLATCAYAGWDPASYRHPESPLQKLIRRTVAKLCDLDYHAVRHADDSCGVPVFALPLSNLALGFARLAAGSEDFPEDLSNAVRRVRDAMRAHPCMVAGSTRFDTQLMQCTELIAKSGAEGVFAVGSLEGWGLALKVSDGTGRAVAPTILGALERRGIRFPREMHSFPITDLRGKTVGRVATLIRDTP